MNGGVGVLPESVGCEVWICNDSRESANAFHSILLFIPASCVATGTTTDSSLLFCLIELRFHVHACSSANSGLVLYQYTAPPASPNLSSLPLHDDDFVPAGDVDANRELTGSLNGNAVRDRDEESVCWRKQEVSAREDSDKVGRRSIVELAQKELLTRSHRMHLMMVNPFGAMSGWC